MRPVVHYMMGGVHTDADGATPLAGLYAAGECANVGLNGANRLGSNSLPECLVFGARAGSAAARYALEQPTPAENPVQQLAAAEAQRVEQTYLQAPDGSSGSAAGGERVATIREALQETMERGAGVFRTGDGLRTAVGELSALRERLGQLRLDDRSRRFNTELFSALELEFMVDVAEAVAASALAREEFAGLPRPAGLPGARRRPLSGPHHGLPPAGGRAPPGVPPGADHPLGAPGPHLLTRSMPPSALSRQPRAVSLEP